MSEIGRRQTEQKKRVSTFRLSCTAAGRRGTEASRKRIKNLQSVAIPYVGHSRGAGARLPNSFGQTIDQTAVPQPLHGHRPPNSVHEESTVGYTVNVVESWGPE